MKFLLLLIFFTITTFASQFNKKMLANIDNLNLKNTTFSFAVFGDNRGRDDILKKIIQNIDKDKDILFSINNGDLVNFEFQSEFEHYLQLIKISKKPIISVLGNHGIGLFENKKIYKSYFGQTNFSFTYKNNYFIIVNDSDDEGIEKHQFVWLKNELKKSRVYKNRFIFMHIPLYDPRKNSYAKGHSLENLQQARELNILFDFYHTTMLFSSHIHSFYQGTWRKTPYIITGGAGAPLTKGGFFHYIKVTVDKNSVTYKVMRIHND